MKFEKKESDISTEIVNAINEKFSTIAFAYKTPVSPYGKSGVSDVHVCFGSYLIVLEVKRPDKRANVTEAQLRFMQRIRLAGGRSAVVCSAQEAIDYIYSATANLKFDASVLT